NATFVVVWIGWRCPYGTSGIDETLAHKVTGRFLSLSKACGKDPYPSLSQGHFPKVSVRERPCPLSSEVQSLLAIITIALSARVASTPLSHRLSRENP